MSHLHIHTRTDIFRKQRGTKNNVCNVLWWLWTSTTPYVFSIQDGTKRQDGFWCFYECLQLLMYVTLLLWWYMTVKYLICVYNNQILTCKCDIFLPYCQLVSLNLSLNMDNWLHNILIRIRNTLLMPYGKLQRRCSHSKSRICRKIVLLLLLIIKTIYGAYL